MPAAAAAAACSNAPEKGGDDGGLEDLLAAKARPSDRGGAAKRGRSASAGPGDRSFKRERKVRAAPV